MFANKALLCINMECVSTTVSFGNIFEDPVACRLCRKPLSALDITMPVVIDEFLPDCLR
jgi:hypothetical protein